jgi:hypothetical protein
MSLVVILVGGYLVLMLVVLLFVVAQFRVGAAADRRQDQYERELAGITAAEAGEAVGPAVEDGVPAVSSQSASVRRGRRARHRRLSVHRQRPRLLR